MQPLAQRAKSYINDTNHFLSKIKKIVKLSEGAILCTMDVSGLYPNIPHGEGLAPLYKFLETRENKQISSDNLAELAETDYIRGSWEGFSIRQRLGGLFVLGVTYISNLP